MKRRMSEVGLHETTKDRTVEEHDRNAIEESMQEIHGIVISPVRPVLVEGRFESSTGESWEKWGTDPTSLFRGRTGQTGRRRQRVRRKKGEGEQEVGQEVLLEGWREHRSRHGKIARLEANAPVYIC